MPNDLLNGKAERLSFPPGTVIVVGPRGKFEIWAGDLQDVSAFAPPSAPPGATELRNFVYASFTDDGEWRCNIEPQSEGAMLRLFFDLYLEPGADLSVSARELREAVRTWLYSMFGYQVAPDIIDGFTEVLGGRRVRRDSEIYWQGVGWTDAAYDNLIVARGGK